MSFVAVLLLLVTLLSGARGAYFQFFYDSGCVQQLESVEIPFNLLEILTPGINAINEAYYKGANITGIGFCGAASNGSQTLAHYRLYEWYNEAAWAVIGGAGLGSIIVPDSYINESIAAWPLSLYIDGNAPPNKCSPLRLCLASTALWPTDGVPGPYNLTCYSAAIITSCGPETSPPLVRVSSSSAHTASPALSSSTSASSALSSASAVSSATTSTTSLQSSASPSGSSSAPASTSKLCASNFSQPTCAPAPQQQCYNQLNPWSNTYAGAYLRVADCVASNSSTGHLFHCDESICPLLYSCVQDYPYAACDGAGCYAGAADALIYCACEVFLNDSNCQSYVPPSSSSALPPSSSPLSSSLMSSTAPPTSLSSSQPASSSSSSPSAVSQPTVVATSQPVSIKTPGNHATALLPCTLAVIAGWLLLSALSSL